MRRAGVVGAGTMGSGIAQVFAQSGVEVHLVDPDADAREQAVRQIERDLARGAERGRWTRTEATAARSRLTDDHDLTTLADAELVVEAVPERLDLKLNLFGRLAEVCSEEAVLATNTSSLLVSQVAAATPHPERVIGLHFFNPPSRMRLVEVVPGIETSPHTVSLAVAAVEAMGKHAVVVRDGIGFLVNRCARPFYVEALKLVQEGIATTEQVDRICRMGGGFLLGPFELIDLIGVDVNLAIAASFYEQSFGEPRWRPSTLQASLVAAGRNGRKCGRGFYEYGAGEHRRPDPEPLHVGGGEGRCVAVAGRGIVGDGIREKARAAGFSVTDPGLLHGCIPWLLVDAGVDGPSIPPTDAPRVGMCARTSLRLRRDPGSAGFHLVPPLNESRLVEVTADGRTDPVAAARSNEFFAALGFVVEHVGDAPGLVLGRIVSQLANEAAFAVAEGVAPVTDIDAAMTLGLNYPRGPITWRSMMGDRHVRAVLSGLYQERSEERYRLAPDLAG